MFVATENTEPCHGGLTELEVIKDVGALATGPFYSRVRPDTGPVLPRHGLVVSTGLGPLLVLPLIAGVVG